MMGVTKLMQNKRFIQCPSFGRWFMSRTWGVRCNILWKLFHSCTLGMSWRTSEYSWAYRDGKPGLPCLAWRATILEIFVTGCTWPRNIPARSVNWVQGAASDNETGFLPLMWLGLKRRSSDSSSFSYILRKIHTHEPFQKSCWLWRSRADLQPHWLVVALKILENVWRTWVENGGFWVLGKSGLLQKFAFKNMCLAF